MNHLKARSVMGHRGGYEGDVMVCKMLGPVFRIVNLRACRISGLESPQDRKYVKKGTVNKNKLDNNISRAKTIVRELALCNTWDKWCTFTIDGSKHNRFDLNVYYKQFAKFINNYNRYCSESEKVSYLLVPEKHADGAWHIHGLLNGIKEKDIVPNKNGYLTWKQYQDKFGFFSFEPIRNKEACAHYILKYITKDMVRSVSDIGAHLYYCSKGLKRSEVVFKGRGSLHCQFDYESDYVKIKEFDCSVVDPFIFFEPAEVVR